MKKLLLIFSFLLPLFTQAQEEIKYGINAGPAFTVIRGDGYAKDFSYGAGYMLGATIEMPLNQRFSFYSGINYERKSSVQKTSYSYTDTIIGPDGTPVGTTTSGETKITSTLDYVTVPVLLILSRHS